MSTQGGWTEPEHGQEVVCPEHVLISDSYKIEGPICTNSEGQLCCSALSPWLEL